MKNVGPRVREVDSRRGPRQDGLVTTIPLIDLDRWFDASPEQRSALAEEVDHHLKRLGFLVVVNHRVPQTVIDACREQCRAFFHLAPEFKANVALRSEAYRGWVGPGLESNAATYGVDTPPDLKETFAYGPVDVPDEELRIRAPVHYAANIWPIDLPEFQIAAEAWWRAGRTLTDELLELCALALGLPQHHLREQCTATTAQVSLHWYPPRGSTVPEDGQFRIGPHTDFGTLTVLDREPGAGGLQVLDEDGAWIDLPYVPRGLVINTGDLIRRWTNDRWCSNQHRVLPPPASNPAEELISLVFFHEPDRDALIEVLPTCVAEDNPGRHAPVVAHVYLDAKMDALAVG
jgi:isopenicillin N synthase-like dioxygenase